MWNVHLAAWVYKNLSRLGGQRGGGGGKINSNGKFRTGLNQNMTFSGISEWQIKQLFVILMTNLIIRQGLWHNFLF